VCDVDTGFFSGFNEGFDAACALAVPAKVSKHARVATLN
jgi:hypothetical protein